MNSLLLGVSLLLVPFPLLAEKSTLEGQMIAFVMASLILLANRIPSAPLRWFVWYFCSWQGFLRFIFVYSLAELAGLQMGMAAAIFLPMMAAVIVFYLATQVKNTSLVLLLLRISVLFQATIAAAQFLGYYPVLWLFKGMGRQLGSIDHTLIAFGTLANPDFLAIYVAAGLPFFFRGHWRICVLPLVFLIFCLPSSSAIIALFLGGSYYYYFNLHRLCQFRYVAALFTILGIYWVTQQDTSIFTSPRWVMWGHTLKLFLHNPIFGSGPNSLLHTEWTGIHNDLLRILLEYGIAGFGLLAAGFIRIFKADDALVASLIISGVCLGANFSGRIVSLSIVTLVIFGFAIGETATSGNLLYRRQLLSKLYSEFNPWAKPT